MRVLLLAGLLACCGSVQAGVKTATANSFVVEHKVPLAATPARAYQALTEVGRWWNPEHSWSGKAGNMTLDARAGGCFCEALPEGGSVQHLQVVFAAPAKMLRLRGALGPLQSEGVEGSLTFELTPVEEGAASELLLRYIVSGYSPLMPLNEWAPAVDGVLLEQVTRLQSWVATGKLK